MSPVRYTDTIGGGGGGGACPEDDFSIEIIAAETVPAINDAASFDFGIAFSETVPAINDALILGLTFADIVPALNDNLFSIGINFTDTIPAINDDLLSLNTSFADTLNAPTDAFELELLFADTVPAQTDDHSGTATWRVGATTASQTGDWQNPTNAQGLHDGANATLTDGALNSNQGTLSLSAYADLPADLGDWTVTSVRLLSYHVVSNFINANNNLVIEYNVGAGFITLATITANENFADPPREFNLPLLSEAEINAMQVRVVYTAGLAVNTATINVDAIEFEVITTKAGF